MLFVDVASNVDKESLRSYVLKKINDLQIQLQQLLKNENEEKFWKRVHDWMITQENEELRKQWNQVELQVNGLGGVLANWIQSAMSSKEQFEFFIQAKAVELATGDARRDYFWALQIRHDQLIAMVEVVEEVIGWLDEAIKLGDHTKIKTSRLMELAKLSVEDRVFLRAEKIQKDREKLVV